MIARLLLLLLAGMLAASPAQAKCEQVRRQNGQLFNMIGPAGGNCTLTLPLRYTGTQGQPLEYQSASIVTQPANGSVTTRVNRAAQVLEVSFKASTREAIEDRFVLEYCRTGEVRVPCIKIAVNVRLSAAMASRAQTFCRPKPFALRSDRPVIVSMNGVVGDRCAIRLFRSDTPLRVSLEERPSKGRAWIESNTVFYIGRETGSDHFKARACKWDDASACSILHVSVEQR